MATADGRSQGALRPVVCFLRAYRAACAGTTVVAVAFVLPATGNAQDRVPGGTPRQIPTEEMRTRFSIPTRSRLILQTAIQSARRNDFRQAALSFADAALLTPRDPLLRLSLGVSLAEQGRLSEAVQQFRRAVEYGGDDPVSLLLLQNALSETGEGAEAQELHQDIYRRFSRPGGPAKRGLDVTASLQRLRAGIKQSPDNPIFQVLLGDAHQLAQNWQDADSAYRTAMQLAPQWVKPRVNLGLSLLAQGKSDDAIRTFEKALTLDPRNVQARLWKADAERRSGKSQIALNTYQQVAKIPNLPPVIASQAITGMGRAFLGSGNRVQAIDKLNEAQKMAPNDPTPSSLIGDIQIRSGEYDAAAAAYDAALRITREGGLFAQRPVLYRSLAEALLSAGSVEKARDVLQQALQEEPRQASLWHRLLAHTYLKRGDSEQAQRELRSALDGETGPFPLETLRAIDAHGALPALKEEYQRERSLSASGAHLAVSATDGIHLTMNPKEKSPERRIAALIALAHIARYQNDTREELQLRKELTSLRENPWDWFLLAEIYDQRIIEPASARTAYLRSLELNNRQKVLSEAAVKWARQRNTALTEPIFKP